MADLTSPAGVAVSVNDAAAEQLIASGWTVEKPARKTADKK